MFTLLAGGLQYTYLANFSLFLLSESLDFMEDSSESDVFSERDEQSVVSDSYEEIEFEDLDLLTLNKNADKSDDEESPHSQELLSNDQWLQEYQQERRVIEAREQELQNRMNRVMEIRLMVSELNYNLFLFRNSHPDFVQILFKK